MAKEFKLPDLGEGIEQGDVVNVLVSEGDRIEAEQSVIELETDKAVIEVPSPFAGTITGIHIKSGDSVKIGQVILTIDEDGTASPEEKPAAEKTEQKTETAEPPAAEKTETAAKPEAPAPAEVKPAEPEKPKPAPASTEAGPIPAAPATRRYARELGVDLRQVPGNGPGGRIVQEDVKDHVRGVMSGQRATVAQAAPPPLPDFSKWGEIERQGLRAIQRKTVETMSTAWAQVPHVTQFDKADVTDLEAFRQRHKAEAESRGGKLTPTILILKAVVSALKTFPRFNASLDAPAQELVLKKYIHIGMAVDTERGLLVPVIRDVDRKNIFELARELVELADRTREGKVDLNELQGGSFTITNLGTIAGTAFTPIVNYPEVAILGIARTAEEPVIRNGRIEPRLMMPLALSYDHRVVNGADGARFIKHLVESLGNPERLLLGG